MESVICVENFSKSFGTKKVIKNISFQVKENNIFAYLGSNGSGKTTTIRALLGIYKADSGNLKILGKKFDNSISNLIGYLPEERGLYLSDTVADVLLYFAKLHGMSHAQAQKNIDSYLEKVQLADKKKTKIKTLSSGQQQKIQFGAAVIHQPKILILDEPMKGLDPVNRQLFIDMILEQKENGSTILFSSHQMEDVQKLADSLMILKNGEIGVYGKVDEVKKQFGKNTIKLSFEGKFIENNDLFQAVISNTYAEIQPNKGVGEQEILKFFVNKGLKINTFDISLPSLNDIFISINKN